MNGDRREEVPPHGRWFAAIFFFAGIMMLVANHAMAESQQKVKLIALTLGPMAITLGGGGIIEPKIIWSIGKYGTHLPVIYKVLGGCLAGVGLLVTVILIFVVYRVR